MPEHRPETIDVAWTDNVVTVSLAMPERGNALTQRVCDELITALTSCAQNAGAIVLTGQGAHFCAGGDMAVISEWHSWSADRRARYVEEGPQAVLTWLLDSPVITVCAVNGAAYGAGLDLTLACDLRIASADAKFSAAFIRLEVLPGDGGAWLLPRYIGMGRALDMLLTGREVTSMEALSAGLVSQVVAADELSDYAQRVALMASRHDPSVVRRMRRMVLDGMTESFEQHLGVASRAISAAAGEAAHVEAVERFLGGDRSG